MIRKLTLNLIPLAFAFLVPALSAAKGPPDWLKKASQVSISSELLQGNPEVVYLYDEGIYEIDTDGTIVSTTRLAMLVRNANGADEAVGSIAYSEDTDKPLSLKAWMMPGKGKKGKTIYYKNRDIIDSVVAGPNGSTITTSRRQWIDGSGEALSGWIFGYEAVLRDRSVSPELFWAFQGAHPSVYSRFELRLPSDWEHSTFFINGNELQASRNGDAYVWEVRNQAALEVQPLGVVYPLMFSVGLHAPNGEREPVPSSWQELAKRYSPYYKTADGLTPDMLEKVSELTAGILDPLDQAKALCEYVQSVNYVSISLELGTGGGHKPRPADEVFASNYGDCKDKSNLLTALLEQQGIEAYSLIVNWDGESRGVQEEWVSPSQFNHCVTAIKVPADYVSPNVVQHEGIGRLLVFDPTNEHAVFGDLDDSLQGTKGMLLAGERGGLIDLPLLPLEARETRRDVQAAVGLGSLVGTFSEVSIGQQAANERTFAFTDDDRYEDRVSRWLAKSIPGVIVQGIDPKDDRATDRFSLSAQFESVGYGKNLRNKTLIFKPILIDRSEALPFGEEERSQSVKLSASCLVESYEIALPEGFEVAELPENRSFSEDFGSYDLRFEHDAAKRALKVEREVRILPKVIPLDRFPVLEAFFKSRIRADQSAVVLEAI